jgi:hypothetical protein
VSENKALWRRVCVTDPKAVKPITGKQYSGNSPKPYWIVERLTDEFGPCGIGWGFNILNERIERFSDSDTLHIAVVRLWYVMDGKRGELEQIGQTKASYMTNAGKRGELEQIGQTKASYMTNASKFMLDEDAPKKSVTDALIKCASYLGFAGDIFSGRWDDSKYVAEANKEWREREAGGKPANDSGGMSASILQDWLIAISEAAPADAAAIVADGLAAATEVKDETAYRAIRAAGKKKEKAA